MKKAIPAIIVAALGLVVSLPAQQADAATMRANALSVAISKIGKPYVYGASGPNRFDCSGLVYYAFKKAGKNWKRHTAQWQYNKSRHIAKRSRRKGDLIFFGNSSKSIKHVAIYAGNGKMIDANSGNYYGHQVTKEPVKGWFSQHYRVYYGQVV